MRVFLDTNVLVSGFATRGLCADVVRLVLAKHELVTFAPVLDEARRALLRKFRLPANSVHDVLSFLEEYLVSTQQLPALRIQSLDAADCHVLASAIAVQADVFVTGDKEVLRASQELPALLIIDPRRLWNKVRTQP